MNIDNVVALLFFLDFFPNVGFGVAPTRPLVSESFQRGRRAIPVRTFTSACLSPCVVARPYTSNSSPSLPANLLYLLNIVGAVPRLHTASTKVNNNKRAVALGRARFSTSPLLSALLRARLMNLPRAARRDVGKCCPSAAQKAKTARHNPRSAGPRNKGRSLPKSAACPEACVCGCSRGLASSSGARFVTEVISTHKK